MDRRKSVVFFCNFPPPYTGQTVGTRLTFDLLRDTFDATAIDLSSRREGGRRVGAPDFGHLRHTLRMLRILRATVARERPDVLYFVPGSTSAGFMRDWLALWVARPFVGRIVAHVRRGNLNQTLGNGWTKLLARAFVQRVDVFIFLSEILAKPLRKTIGGEKISVIPNPIDAEVRCTDEEVSEKVDRRSWSHRPFRIAFVSNMIPSKGYRDLAEALARLERRLIWRADFAGRWNRHEDRTEFETRLRELGIAGRTIVHGPLGERAEIRRLLLDADVFVLPTYYPVEAQPRSIIEALNAGTPVIATAHASIPEYVKDGVNGFLVPPRDPEAIARAIGKLTEAESWKRMARAARTMYLETFSPAPIQQSLLEVIGS